MISRKSVKELVLTRCAGDVHLLEAPALEDADGELAGGGDVSDEMR